MKCFNYISYQKTYTAVLIETTFKKPNQEHFLLSFQKDDFSTTWETLKVTQRLGFLMGRVRFLPRSHPETSFETRSPFR